MPIADDQIDLLKTAIARLHTWQTAAQGVDVLIQQIVMEFPPADQANQVRFTWDSTAGKFDVST